MDAIMYQTESVNKKAQQTDESTNVYIEKAKYQMDMYNSVKFVNGLLLLFYIIVFTVIHVMFISQYISGVKRNEVADTFWLSIFFFYPYMIYYIERNLYFAITYVLSFIYGKTYVSNFDKLLLFDEYYAEPETQPL